jgi:predicted alpha/beta superfamily hydrolase
MKQTVKTLITLLAVSILLPGCSKKIKQQEDEIYSRHLQTHIKLTIISTPMPDEKSEMNLLLLNDGQDMEQLKVKEAMTGLYQKNLLQPVIIVGIKATNPNEIYGVAGHPDYQNRGSKADKYAAFIDNELYAFIKKRAGVRKFKSVTIAGSSLGGLSALDIAWNHADKIDKVGVFSGAFRFSKRKFTTETADYSDKTDRIFLSMIQSSRKKPALKYWFYGDDADENGTRYQDSVKINHTKDLVEIIKSKNVCPPGDIVYKDSAEGKHDHESWSKVFPDFLVWAVGK